MNPRAVAFTLKAFKISWAITDVDTLWKYTKKYISEITEKTIHRCESRSNIFFLFIISFTEFLEYNAVKKYGEQLIKQIVLFVEQ